MYIEIKGINFKYSNNKENTLNDFGLNIKKGEIVSIFGESGSGKSTLLRIIAGLEKPINGSIKISDKVMVENNIFESPENRGLSMVFQDYALFPHMTVEKNIKFGLKNKSKQEKNEILDKMLKLVELVGYKDRYPYELSGGQQQRIALARALAPEPSVLLLDEPFSNLDSDLQQGIREELKRIIKFTNTTTIFVTHDREDCKAIADRVVILNKGKIVKQGKVKDILK